MDSLGRRPVLTALIGALVIAWSAPLVRLADVPPATAASLRCLLALPLLALLARREQGRHGRLPVRTRQVCALAGIFFACDLVLWHHVIAAVGAGLATVLGNLQVLVVAAVAWWLLGERPPARLLAALPVLLLGVALVSGALGGQTYGRDPRLGVLLGLATSVAYALFLLVLRQGSTDLRLLAGPLLWATGSAAAFAALLGVALGELVVPGWQALFWLAVLALTAQVIGWLLIQLAAPPARRTDQRAAAGPADRCARRLGGGAVRDADTGAVRRGGLHPRGRRRRDGDAAYAPTRPRRTGWSPNRPRRPPGSPGR